jgi:hypothetical protein
MTKNFKSYILSALAVAAIALSSCSKSDEGMTPAQKKDFSVVLTGVSTKTTNDGMSTLWAANDAINLFHAPLGGEATTGMEYVSDGEFSTTQSGATATFTGTLAADFDETLTYNWYAFYPYTKQITTPANSSAGYTYVGGRSDRSQTQTGNNSTAHICGTNYPIAGILNKVAGSEKPVITMRHLSSLVAVKVTNGLKADPITVSKVSITADGVDIVGSYYIDFTDPNNPSFVPSNTNYVSSTANLEVTDGEAIAAGESATFYLAIKPFTVNEGDDFTVSVTATNGAQEKVISADKNYVFSAGKMKTINFTYDQQEVSYDFTTVAELNTLAMDDAGTTAKSYFGKLTNAVITFVSPDTKTVIISDGSASIMYYNNAGTTLKQGQTYSGDLTVSALNYKSQYTEISSMDVTLFTGDGAVVEPTTLTLAQVIGNYNTYQNEYAKMTDLEVTAVSGKNITVTDGTNSYVVYLNSGTVPCVAGDNITAIGTITKFISGSNTTEELKVWDAESITVNSHTATKHKVTYTQPATGGTFYVCYASNSSTEIKSGDEVMEGEVVTIQATPASGFKFNKWTVTGSTPGDATKATTSFTMGAEDVTIAVEFISSSTLILSMTMQDYATVNNCTISAGNDVTCYPTLTLNSHVTMSTSGAANCGSFWQTTGTQWRLYQNKNADVTISVSAGHTLKAVTFTYSVTNTGTLLDGSTVIASGTKVELSGTSKTFTVGNTTSATNGQVRITAVTVEYE